MFTFIVALFAFLGVVPSFATDSITGLQWNPHYECFTTDATTCKQGVYDALKQELTSDRDFANIVELEDAGEFENPASWARHSYTCEQGDPKYADQISLFYNSAKWKPSIDTPVMGCSINGADRAYIVWAFTNIADPSLTTVVVGAHFGHEDVYQSSIDTVGPAIGQVATSAGTTNIFFMGDINQPISKSSDDVMNDLEKAANIDNSKTVESTELLVTCCMDSQFMPTSGDAQRTYDRVIANFGNAMETKMLFDPAPTWAEGTSSKFHKGIVGSLSLGMGGSSMKTAVAAAEVTTATPCSPKRDDQCTATSQCAKTFNGFDTTPCGDCPTPIHDTMCGPNPNNPYGEGQCTCDPLR
jgi:hypothetical protein